MDNDGDFACPACDRTFATFHALYGHTLQLHDFAVARSDASYADAQPVARNADSAFACPVDCCGFKHPMLFRVQDHTEQAHDFMVVRAAPLDATDDTATGTHQSSDFIPIQRGRNGTLECPQHCCTFETDEMSSLAVHVEARHEIGVAIGPPRAQDGDCVRAARVQHMLSTRDAHPLLPATVSDDTVHNGGASLEPTPVASQPATTPLLPNPPAPETDGTTAAVMPMTQMPDLAPTISTHLDPVPVDSSPVTTRPPNEPSPETGRVTAPTASSSPRLAVSPTQTMLLSAMTLEVTTSAVLNHVEVTTEAAPMSPPLSPPSSRPHDARAASLEEQSPQPECSTDASPSPPLVRRENADVLDDTPTTSSAATFSDVPGLESKRMPCTPPVEAASPLEALTVNVSSPPVAQGSESAVDFSLPAQGADLDGQHKLSGDDGQDNADDDEAAEDGDDGLDYDDEPRLNSSESATVFSVDEPPSEPEITRVASSLPKEETTPLDEPFVGRSPPPSPGANLDYDDSIDLDDDDLEGDDDEPRLAASWVATSATDAPSELVMLRDVPTSPLAHAVEEPLSSPLSPDANLGLGPDSPRTPKMAPVAHLGYRPETPETPSLPPTPDVARTPSPFHNMRHSVRPTPPRRSSYHSDDDDQITSPGRGRAPARRSLAGFSSSESSASPLRQRPLEPFECPEASCQYEHVNFSVFKFHCLHEHGLHIRQDEEDDEDEGEEPSPPPMMPPSLRRPTNTEPDRPADPKAGPRPPASQGAVAANAAGEYACPTPACPYKKTNSISKLQTHCKAKHAYDVKKADDVPSLPKRRRKRLFVNATLVNGDEPGTKYLRALEALEPGQEVYVCVT
ncbi:hypothetical protein SDRG_10195 [Saprolegnia diclina VS20]|uniref:C2H2-type domain-containing protein n=1 Tax=Saprolegnia diclina (strain VS20) TaxID=1156394 RepID=T0QEL8_SAPDV|nr:hypothetical protein SDRG_10195 [Saprolegnia diclina VS20]EQC31995.1 hypothetical protein SDRG_10195 [Saprolegnia diclina VS20]|eukprot:XP_008614397.1 hypothetical protein SDRG_10195 [Saprolegnia diclina VS20]